ncbi:MAG TPA: glutathione S-transferase family protein [Beijerinckiaceae bacterium]|jgi:glutathione S-transferase
MSQLTLYHATPSRSSVTLWMLEELGQPYDIKILDLQKGEQLRPDYRAINPMGKVPAIVHDGVAITESAAICAYLADAFPEAGLGVPVGSPERGPYLKWLFFGPGCVEPAVTDRAFPRKEEARPGALGYRDFETVMGVLADAVRDKAFLVGGRFTAADVVIGSNLRWGMMFGLVPKRPEFEAYVAGLDARPAFQRARAKDQELMAT